MSLTRLIHAPSWLRPASASRLLPRGAALGLLLGGVVFMAPDVGEAKERCATKPVVCARLKAQRAQQPAAREGSLVVRAAAPNAALASADTRCSSKPMVCARLRNQDPRPAPALAPVQLASQGERCTTKPVVCARLKNKAGAPVILANDEAPATSVD